VAARVGWPALRNNEEVTAWSKWLHPDEVNEMIRENADDRWSREYLVVCPLCGKKVVQPDCWFSTWRVEDHLIYVHNVGMRAEDEDWVGLVPRPKWCGPKIVMNYRPQSRG